MTAAGRRRQIRRRILPRQSLTGSLIAPTGRPRALRPAAAIRRNQIPPNTAAALRATSHFRFPYPLQNAGSGSGKPIEFRDQRPSDSVIVLTDAGTGQGAGGHHHGGLACVPDPGPAEPGQSRSGPPSPDRRAPGARAAGAPRRDAVTFSPLRRGWCRAEDTEPRLRGVFGSERDAIRPWAPP